MSPQKRLTEICLDVAVLATIAPTAEIQQKLCDAGKLLCEATIAAIEFAEAHAAQAVAAAQAKPAGTTVN